MVEIKFGTDGWRAIIAKEFTVDNVARIAHATARYVKERKDNPTAVVGHDCRFNGELFAETVAKVLTANGIKVLLAEGYVSTPMVSLGTKKFNGDIGVIITASHNPPEYSGYKLKGHYGGPLFDEDIKQVEKLIPQKNKHDIDYINIGKLIQNKMVNPVDLEYVYCNYLEEKFDLEAIRKSKLKFAFDAMYGSGQNVMRRLFPGMMLLHCERQPYFGNIPPEPLYKNLHEFSEKIKLAGNIDCGLAIDGDADRLALFDKTGNYVDPHHIMLLLINYLHKQKNLTGKVATGFSSTVKINKLCELFGLPLEVVKIGFKHISGLMLKENILLGGEESGGIAVTGHIPERDGIYNGLLVFEAMVKTGKSLREMIDEVYKLTGPFAFERKDLKINHSDKKRIVKNCQKGKYNSFGKYKVVKTETLDGFKYYFNDNEWLMIRPSGTEPVLRTYAESSTREEALKILQAGYDTIMKK